MSFGDVLTAAASIFGGERANRQNRRMARQQMAFQERLSSTSYQRSMADMRQAGLNPILAYQQGGASSPAGASSTSVDPISPAISTATQAARARAEIQNLREMNHKIKSDVLLNSFLSQAAAADAKLKLNSAKVADANSALLHSQIPGAKIKESIDKSDLGEGLGWADRISETLGNVLGIIKPFKSSAAKVRYYDRETGEVYK